jgi:hypothetical protein
MAAAARQHREVLGSGTYGCALKPDYDCVGADDIKRILKAKQKRFGSMYVSKLIGTEKEMLKEWAHFQMVKTVDPDGEFTVPVLGHCSAVVPEADIYDPSLEDPTSKPSDLKADRPSQKCKTATAILLEQLKSVENGKNAGELRQLVLAYGGVSYADATKTESLGHLLTCLTPIIHGIDVMNGSNIYHKDIKLQNIMYMNDAAKLIDFGMMTNSQEEVFSLHTISSGYYIWPPECDLLFNIEFPEAVLNPETMKLEARKKLPSTNAVATYDTVFKVFGETVKEVIDTQITNMTRDFYAGLDVEDVLRFVVAKKQMADMWADKFDVFSMGISVLRLLLFYRVDIPDALSNWIYGTTNFNAYERWNAATAAVEWDKLLPSLAALNSVWNGVPKPPVKWITPGRERGATLNKFTADAGGSDSEEEEEDDWLAAASARKEEETHRTPTSPGQHSYVKKHTNTVASGFSSTRW